MIWLNLALVWLSSDALSSVPVHVLSLGTVCVVSVTHFLALTKVFYCSKHVLCNGFLVFNDLLNDDCFREALFNSLWLN